jgi:hypothetical protein
MTGSKKGSISFGGCFENNDGDTCPKMDPTTFLIGRTEYNIMMYDSRGEGRKWNITFYDYSTNIGRLEVNNDYSECLLKRLKRLFIIRNYKLKLTKAYLVTSQDDIFSDYAHFTDSSMGVLVSVDRLSGNLLWKLSLGSPIVALYR